MSPHVIQYKQGKAIVVADVLSRRYVLISTLPGKFLGFEYIRELYKSNLNFSSIFDTCEVQPSNKFNQQNGYLFHENTFFIP